MNIMDFDLIKGFPALAPPIGVKPNFANSESDGYIVIVVGSIFLVLMIFFMSIRAYSKIVIAKAATRDDLTCSIGGLLTIAYFSISVVGVQRGPVGIHQWNLLVKDALSDVFLIVGHLGQVSNAARN